MNECKGAIILGYPQIYVTKGKIKENEKNDFHLPTEWNHIETTLAYMNKMPLLVIHHKGISRGIFDHGAIGKYLYEKDLTKPNWFLSDDIKGAIKTWKSSIREPQADKTIISKPVSESHSSTPLPFIGFPLLDNRLDKMVESVLLYLFNSSTLSDRTLKTIEKKFDCNRQAALYYVEVLKKEKLIIDKIASSAETYYSLTPKGREYVMTNKLASGEHIG
jgi:predicted transcriptional regulator